MGQHRFGSPPALQPPPACPSATLYSTQEDPIGLAGGLNLYGYGDGDPVNNSDPFGLCPDCILDAVAVVAGVVDIAKNGVTAARLATLGVDVVAAVIPGLPSASGLKIGAKLGETASTYIGRAAHKAWDAGEGFVKEVTLKGGRADAVNVATRTVKELKPNNPRAIRKGAAQVTEYAKKLEEKYPGEPFRKIVETYERPQ